ncbi:uncharacterized protein LOC105285890 [Ooceraea biroi]|nr:uncharacterized protein LOC105285890 [Ooceraea biroi]
MKKNQKTFDVIIGEECSTALNLRDKMDDKTSMFLVIILAIGGLTMMIALLTCYACIFRDLCCRLRNRSKRQRQHSFQQEFDHNRSKFDTMPLNDITQQRDSMPTESEKI